MILGEAPLKGSSEGIRSSQRCSESLSCIEKYSRMSKPTLPLAGAGLSAAGLLALAFVFAADFAVVFVLDLVLGAGLSAASGFAEASSGALSGRSSL